MNEFAGSVLGNNENICVTASCGRNFVPVEREYVSETFRKLSMAFDYATVLAFVVFTIVMSI